MPSLAVGLYLVKSEQLYHILRVQRAGALCAASGR